MGFQLFDLETYRQISRQVSSVTNLTVHTEVVKLLLWGFYGLRQNRLWGLYVQGLKCTVGPLWVRSRQKWAVGPLWDGQSFVFKVMMISLEDENKKDFTESCFSNFKFLRGMGLEI